MKTKRNITITLNGKARCGKTYLAEKIMEMMKKENMEFVYFPLGYPGVQEKKAKKIDADYIIIETIK
jgi:uridine kinase